jgi:hypothetical protein
MKPKRRPSPKETVVDNGYPKTCQDCAGIGRAWIEGLLQDCPECGGSGWDSPTFGDSRWGYLAYFSRPKESRVHREAHP